MNTTKLKRFATEARNKLRQGISNRLMQLGFNESGIPRESPALSAGGATWREKGVTMAFYHGFKALEEQIRKYGVNHVVEEAAYTWFNRLMAIRILTMNELCEPVLRYVGSTRTPLIVDEARQGNIPTMDDEDRRALMQLLDDDTKTTEQFAMLITAFCHNTPLIAKCFGLTSDYTDVLFPANILSENGFIDMLNTTDFISDKDYRSSELLGWLYQFYISEKKDQVFAKKGKYDADDIPAATQIFTPNWIVKYMVQNAIVPQLTGRSGALAALSDDELKSQFKYLVITPDFETAQGRASSQLEELKVADLACGSGHILNECFDLLYDLYISEGYSRREAIECIFTKNLTGIDIDTRAKQLATFALMLKACQRDASLVDASLMPMVYDMSGMPEESRELGSIQIFDEPNSDNPVIAALSTHYDAIVMNPPYMGGGSMSPLLANYVKENYPYGKADLATVFVEAMPRLVKEGGKYAFIIPPSWMFLSGFESLRKSIIENQSIESLLHLSRGVFGADFGASSAVITNIKNIEAHGNYFRLVERTFQEFDQNHLRMLFEKTLENPLFRFKFKDYTKDAEDIVYSEDGANIYYPIIAQKDFENIPGTPLAYWVSENMMKTFTSYPKMSTIAKPHSGLGTGNTELFLRLWFEVNPSKINNTIIRKRKWIKYNKGGAYRRWYGNLEYVVNWENEGEEMKRGSGFRSCAFETYSQPNMAWSNMFSGKMSIRYFAPGIMQDSSAYAATLLENHKVKLNYLIGLFNTKILEEYKKLLNTTMHFVAGDFRNIPIIYKPNSIIESVVLDCISIATEDWDAHETSWDFRENELVKLIREENGGVYGAGARLIPVMEAYCQKWESLFMKLHANEEELNRRFIDIYGLQDELTHDVPLDEITILQQGEISISDKEQLIVNKGVDGESTIHYSLSPITFNSDVVMKQFISYAVGCMMGRYRLDRPGLAIAHPNETPEEVAEYPIPGTDEKFWIDTDGIIPLLPEDCGFHDNAANRMATFVRQVLGEQTQTENLNFIEECLGKSIEQYFIKDFWKDHKKMYQNRPIYWLFASKKGAFQVLVYVHRMNVATVERIRSRYLLPYIERLNKRIEDLQVNESTLSTKQRNLLKSLRAQVAECEEYHNRLAVVAERGIVPDLDDGIIKNHALFGDIVAKLK